MTEEEQKYKPVPGETIITPERLPDEVVAASLEIFSEFADTEHDKHLILKAAERRRNSGKKLEKPDSKPDA